MKARDLQNIPDVQSTPDSRKLAIDKVGIKAIRHPMRIQERAGGVQHTVASFNMYVCLPHHFKGTHMSRFVEILEAHEREITVETFQEMLREMVDKLEAEEGHIEMSFPYFVEKKAPVSGVRSLMDYEVTFTGEIRKGRQSFTMKVVVPVTSLCPCSKQISERGAHNQRSHVTVTARTNEFVWIEELVDFIVKNQAKDGSWDAGENTTVGPVVDTMFALLFLSRGTTPIIKDDQILGAVAIVVFRPAREAQAEPAPARRTAARA